MTEPQTRSALSLPDSQRPAVDKHDSEDEHGSADAAAKFAASAEIIKFQETQKTIRTIVVSITALLGLGMIVVGIVMTTSTSWAVAGAMTGGFGIPVAFVWKNQAKLKASIKLFHKGTADIELSVDQFRSSSDLNPDGTTDHD